MEPHLESQPATLHVRSSAFGGNGRIPTEHTADGADVSPPLAWSAPPPGTKSVALIVDDPDAPDPDAPKRTWVHWVVTGLPPEARSLPAGGPLPDGAVAGKNDWGDRAWGGPNPPIGRHRYVFKLYALDVALAAPGITKAELLSAMRGHILAEGELIGTYAKPK